MSDYITGLNALIGTDAVGSISDSVTDYDYGEKQVVELNQYFNALGRPKEFEPAVEAVYASYQKAKAWEPLGTDKVLRWKNATAMKQVGADASQKMAELESKYGKPAPSKGSSNVYEPDKDKPTSWTSYVPWWAWAIGGTVTVGVVGWFVVPPIVAMIARRKLR